MIRQEIIDDLDIYIKEVEKSGRENPRLAKENAIQSLIKSGVLDNSGNPKNHIVDRW